MKSISLVGHNIIANFFGGMWTGLVNLIFVSFFIRIIGIEAYGLIGIFTSLTALFAAFEFGLSSTLSRELSRLSVMKGSDQESRDLVRTLELLYWSIGILIGIGVILLAPFITHHWVNPRGIPMDVVKTSIMMMGLCIAFQWPSSLYSGSLTGLQRQVLLNAVKIILVTLQYGGAIFVLWFISPTILTFFVWQLVMSVISTVVWAITVWRILPGYGLHARFSGWLLKKSWRFATGMMGIAALVTILHQLDKIILSKMLTLKFFGYYTLAFSIANILIQLVGPIASALFPRFSQLVVKGEEKFLSSLYHEGCQIVAFIVLPVAATLAFYSKEILFIWLKNPETVANSHVLLSLLVVGTAMNTLVTLPYVLQLAYGFTRLVFLQNLFSVIILIPLMIWMIKQYGPAGAAIVWVILNAAYVFILIPFMHRRFLKSEMWQWYSHDLALPVITIIIVALGLRVFMPVDVTINFLLFWIPVTYLLGLLSLAGVLPLIRKKITTVLVFIKNTGLLSWSPK